MLDPDLSYITELVRERAAIVLGEKKAYLVESRMNTLCRAEAIANVHDLVAQMKRDPGGPLDDQVVEAMTTNETSFFRDRHPFDVLRQELLPSVLESRNAAGVRIWSAACSTGQEPYSIAMLLREHFPSHADASEILGTDLSTEVLERARSAEFRQIEVNRGLPVSLLLEHFDQVGSNWQLKEPIRRMVDFRTMNLIEKWPDIGTFDVVFLRNVMIYFDASVKKQILGGLKRVMRPGGYLFLGAAETTVNLDEDFVRHPTPKSSCYQLRGD